MHRTLAIVLLSALPLIASAEPAQRQQRASGLWKVTPATSPFSWEICVDQQKDRLIDDDLWAGFETECSIKSQSRQGDTYRFDASCKDATLSGSVTGDLAKAYSISADTTFSVNGKPEGQHHVIQAERSGDCPADMAPGSKKMRGGLIMKSIYQGR